MGATLSLAAPTATAPKGYEPSKPEPYGYQPPKPEPYGHEPSKPEPYGHQPSKPQPYGPTKSVEHKPWKRHIDIDVEEEASPVKREAEASPPESYGPEPKPYPSGGYHVYERDVPVMEAPEHFEVLTA
ncbi:MAG: hypothetical protein Q9159_006391 [Coniocarpon cinnabarinum]